MASVRSPGPLARAYGQPPVRPQVIEAPWTAPVENSLLEYCGSVWRNRRMVLVIMGLCIAMAFTAGLLQRQVFRARVTLEIQDLNADFLNRRDVDPTATTSPNTVDSYLRTQIGILQSETLAERAVIKANLEQRSAALPCQPGMVKRLLQRLGWWQPLTAVFNDSPSRSLLMKTFRWLPPGSVSTHQQIVSGVLDNLRVESSVQTRIVNVYYSSPNPQIAADFVNTLAGEYVQQNLEVRWNATQRTGDWLTRQVDDLKRKLEASEHALQDNARQNRLMFTGENENVAEDRLKQLQSEYSKAQSDRMIRQSEYDLARTAPPESLPEVLNDARLRDAEASLAELRRQFASMSLTLTPSHYKVQRLRSEIDEMEAQGKKQRANILTRVKNEYESALQREGLLYQAYLQQEQAVSEQVANAIRYNMLKHEVVTNRQIYDSLMQKVKEAGIAAALNATNIRIVDPAKPPLLPYKPNIPLCCGIGLAAGLFLGCGVVIVRERLNGSVQTPGQSSAIVDAPELAVIPYARPAEPAQDSAPLVTLGIARGYHPPRLQPAAGSVGLFTLEHQPADVSEAFRSAQVSLLSLTEGGQSVKVIVITSPQPLEGKTTVAANLAISFTETHDRVLLIDADLRRPRLHDVFGVANTWGLSNFILSGTLVQDASLTGLARPTGIRGLFVLPSGSPTVEFSRVLYSPQFKEMLARFRADFDLVILDTPPVGLFSDARLVARHADGAVLVLRCGSTPVEEVISASQVLERDGVRILGSILNDCKPQAKKRAYEKYYELG